MKKLTVLIMAAVLILGLCACGSSGSAPAPSTAPSEAPSAAPSASTEPVEGQAEEQTPAEAPAPAETPAAEPEAPATEEPQEPEPEEEAFSLVGEWKQTNSNDPTSYHVATITEDTIEIFWASDDDDIKMLYWAGTFESPAKDKSTTITSQADHEQNDSALLASTADTKDFEYKKGVISYELTAMGVTMTVEMERVG